MTSDGGSSHPDPSVVRNGRVGVSDHLEAGSPCDGIPNREEIHDWFGLSYANYLVLHRSLLQEMPADWQARFVSLLNEFWEVWDSDRVPHSFTVHLRDDHGRFVSDPFSHYRHPDHRLIAAARKPPLTDPR